MRTRAFEYRHVVGFEETNLVGNVYYVNHLRWQGRCREMFLRENAPSVLTELTDDLVLATTSCSCDYFEELQAFDEVILRMRLSAAGQNRVAMEFEYWRPAAEGETLIARGRQEIASLRRTAEGATPCPLPRELRDALRSYSAGSQEL